MGWLVPRALYLLARWDKQAITEWVERRCREQRQPFEDPIDAVTTFVSSAYGTLIFFVQLALLAVALYAFRSQVAVLVDAFSAFVLRRATAPLAAKPSAGGSGAGTMTPERSAGSPSDDSQLAASPVEGWRELVAELRLRSATLEERAEKALIERDTAKAAMASATDLAKSAVDQLAELEAANATLTVRLEDALSYAGALEERLSRAVDLPPASPAASTSPA